MFAYMRSPYSASAAAERLWITDPEVCGASERRLRRARASQWSVYFESLAVRPQNAGEHRRVDGGEVLEVETDGIGRIHHRGAERGNPPSV
jgi:hypothetical protein